MDINYRGRIFTKQSELLYKRRSFNINLLCHYKLYALSILYHKLLKTQVGTTYN